MFRWIKHYLCLLVLVVVATVALADWREALQSPPVQVLIPAGEFMMGIEDGPKDAAPVHAVRIDPFYMDAFEVTNAQYLAFCEDTDHQLPEFWTIEKYRSGPEFPDHPVVGVSHRDAEKYAAWCGKRLPSEAEWEYAARGGLEGLKYSTGNEPDKAGFNYKSDGTRPVGSYPPNGFDLYDMTGNVREWVADYYQGDYYSVSPTENPLGPEEGKLYVIRGGGWHSGSSCNGIGSRHALAGGWQDYNVGFRCAQDINQE
ncbi:MAG: formylglycine-generating enzyme family protein [bacterium]|nr:formylglycine-generating enzyme family protein [bacterium]